MLSITHILYLGSALLLLGVATMVWHREPRRQLFGAVLVVVGPVVVFAAFARAWGHPGGQALAILLGTLAGAYIAVTAALMRGQSER